MPKYMVTGSVPFMVRAYDNWGSDHTEYRNGRIRFEAENLRAAQAHVTQVVAKRKMGEVYALYLLEGSVPTPVPLMTPNLRVAIIEALSRVSTLEYPAATYEKFSDAELQKLLQQIERKAEELSLPILKRHEKIEEILDLLQRPPETRTLAWNYLNELPDTMLEHVSEAVKSWKQTGGKKSISAALSEWLRPAVRKELFRK